MAFRSAEEPNGKPSPLEQERSSEWGLPTLWHRSFLESKLLIIWEPQGLLVAIIFLRSEHIRGNDTSLCSCSHPTWFQSTLGQSISCLQGIRVPGYSVGQWVVCLMISTKSREPNLSATVVITSRPQSMDQAMAGNGNTMQEVIPSVWVIRRSSAHSVSDLHRKKPKVSQCSVFSQMWSEFKSCAKGTCVCLLTAHHGSGLSEATCERSQQCLFLVDWVPRSITGRKQDFFTFLLGILKLVGGDTTCLEPSTLSEHIKRLL